MLYKVLKEGIRQRTGEGGWSSPKVGEIIQVSDIAAPSMLEEGWIGDRGSEETKPRKKKKAAWLGLGAEEPETPKEEEKE